MQATFEQPEKDLAAKVNQINSAYKDALHNLGLGEVKADKEKEFDWEQYGLGFSSVEKNRGEFKFDYDLDKTRELIKTLEQELKASGESAWAMPERNQGQILEACFAGLEYLEDKREQFATLVFRLTKNHPLEDGNKRISSVLFVLGLLDNGISIEELKSRVDLEEFGMVMSQLDNSKIDEVRQKLKQFLENIGFEH
jgi:prophage maintenance system killer protein